MMKKFLTKYKRKLIQLYSALLFNCYGKGYISGDIFKGITKNICTPGLNCYSCPGATTACPLGALQNAFADSGKNIPYYMLGIIMLYGVLLGRWICGWLCPFGFVQELFYKIKTPKLKKNTVTKVLSYLKYPVLVLFVVILPLIYMLRDFPLPAFCKYICPAGTFGGALGLLINPANADKFGMLGFLFTWKFVLMVSIIVGCVFIYRMFCRFLCPLGALYGLFNRIAIFGIKLEKKSCISCGKCVESCKMDISRVGDMECISCGECIPVCPTKAISWKGKNIILPPNEIENKLDKIEAKDPFFNEAETRAELENKRSKRVTVITAAVCAILVLILGFAITYANFIYKPASTENIGNSAEASEKKSSVVMTAAVSESEEPTEGYEVGNLATSWDLKLVLEDGSLSIEELRGKVVVINFWGTWCGPCKAELPHFNELAEEFSDSVEFYVVHSVSGSASAKEYIIDNFNGSKMNWVFDQRLDANSDLYFTLLGGTNYYPRTVIIDESGVITFAKDGAISYDALKNEILRAGGGQVDEIDQTARAGTFIIVFDIVITVLLAVGVFLTVFFIGIKKPKEEKNKASTKQ